MNKITDIKDFLCTILIIYLINDQVAAPPRGPHTTRHCALYIVAASLDLGSRSPSSLSPSLIANGYERTYWATTVHGTFLLRSVSFI